MQQVRVNANTAAPKAIRWRGHKNLFLGLAVAIAFDCFFLVGEVLVAGEVDLDGADRVEAVGAGHGGYVGARIVFGGGMQNEHAEADKGVAEEDGDTEDDHDEEHVNFLAEVFAGEGKGKVWGC